MIQRVIAVRPEGVELEYDLPKETKEIDRARQWQFPARVFKSLDGGFQLLNGPELETRVESWLKLAKLERSACGQTIFTWNVFRIECDPQTVIQTIENLDIGFIPLADGASYRDTDALAPGTLAKQTAEGGQPSFTTEMTIDPEAQRRMRAEADVVLGKMMGKPVTQEQALQNRAGDTISGKILVLLTVDATGIPLKRTKVTTVEVIGRETETRTTTETIERKLISQL